MKWQQNQNIDTRRETIADLTKWTRSQDPYITFYMFKTGGLVLVLVLRDNPSENPQFCDFPDKYATVAKYLLKL